MNKRMKKKRALEYRVKKLEILCNFLLSSHTQLDGRLGKLQAIVSENAAATNNRFDEVETESRRLRVEVDKLKKSQKKSWFSK